MVAGDPLEKRLQLIYDSLTAIRHELKDIRFRLNYLIENFRDHFGP